jgi:hypothetical protein
MMRTSRRVVLLMVMLLAGAGACGDDEPEGASATTEAKASGPSVKIATPADKASVGGNVVNLDLETTGFEVVKADGDTSGKTGHFHIFVDKAPVAAGATIPKEPGIIHSTDDPVAVTGLAPGSHRLVVVLGDGTHNRIGSVQDEITVTVKGPSVDATAPATLAAGAPLSIDVVAEGVTLVKADGDTTGKSGHLHALVDRKPSQYMGQPLPVNDPGVIHSATSPIVVNGLAAGEHTIWIVLGNGSHVPFDPPVMDKLTVTVS